MQHLNSLIETQTAYTDQVFKDVRLERVQLVSSEFYDCTFVRCSLVESVLRDCRLAGCSFQACHLGLLQVPNSTFSDTRFEDSKIIGVNWTRANWPAARLHRPIGFFKCAISHSTFIGLSLRQIQIRDCVAVDVDFREADLSQADLQGVLIFWDVAQRRPLGPLLKGAIAGEDQRAAFVTFADDFIQVLGRLG
jgi:fluoroquinolone resistance protein